MALLQLVAYVYINGDIPNDTTNYTLNDTPNDI